MIAETIKNVSTLWAIPRDARNLKILPFASFAFQQSSLLFLRRKIKLSLLTLEYKKMFQRRIMLRLRKSRQAERETFRVGRGKSLARRATRRYNYKYASDYADENRDARIPRVRHYYLEGRVEARRAFYLKPFSEEEGFFVLQEE